MGRAISYEGVVEFYQFTLNCGNQFMCSVGGVVG